MTNTTTEQPTEELPPPVPPVPPVEGPQTTATPEPGGRRRSGWHIAAVVVGCLLLIPGLSIAAGGVATTLTSTLATDDGYFDATLHRVGSDGVAVATIDLWDHAADDDDWPWVLDWLDLDVRITVDGVAGSDEVFVGIARSRDVEAYLAGSRYSELVEIDGRRARYIERRGAASVEAPGDQLFWTATASGEGEQRLDWEARGGRWSVVLMNTEGTSGVAADVEIGVRSDLVLPIGIILLVVGGVMTLGSMALIVTGVRGRRCD